MDDYLQIKIIPDYDSARKLLGYNEYDDPKDDDILYTQSYYMEVVDILDDDIFTIAKGEEGEVNSNLKQYLVKKKSDLSHKEDFLIDFHLPPGKYKYAEKDQVIFRL
jgi:hypothetical protein